jgi:hypothetical protein
MIGLAQGAEQPGGTRPLLKQLNEETQSLYREVQAGVVRVQLPPPRWAAGPVALDDAAPLDKWAEHLDSAVRQALDGERKRALKGERGRLVASVAKTTTQPATAPATTQHGQSPIQQSVGAWTLSSGDDDTIVIRPNGNDAGALRMDAGGGIDRQGQIVAGDGRLNIDVAAGGSFTPNNIGLLLDADGHVLVPVCVEKESFGGEEVRVMVGPGQMTTARFVGSDRQTNVTVLKLTKPLGTPVKLADSRPAEGNLTMFLSPNSGVGRLMIWTNELRDWGVVVSMDGKVYGFTRQGQFLTAAGCRPIVRQLLAGGEVRRAKLGLAIAEVPPSDPARESEPALGSRPAVRVEEVAPRSPAERAALKQGDLIVGVNGEPVGDPSGFAAAITGEDTLAPVKVTLLRDGTEQTIAIEFSQK